MPGDPYPLSIPILCPPHKGRGSSQLSTEKTLLPRNGVGDNTQNTCSWWFFTGLAAARTRMLCPRCSYPAGRGSICPGVGSRHSLPRAQGRALGEHCNYEGTDSSVLQTPFLLVALSPSILNSRAMNIQEKNVLKIGDIFRIGSH